MRMVPVVLALVMLGVGGALLHWERKRADGEQSRINGARAAVRLLGSEVRGRGGLGQVPVNGRGWPRTIDPAWFGGSVPRNPLVPATHPWLEVAPEWQYRMTDPPVRIALTEDEAAFWYNPATGIVRARVSQAVSDERALEVYNEVNGTALKTLFLPVESAASVPEEE